MLYALLFLPLLSDRRCRVPAPSRDWDREAGDQGRIGAGGRIRLKGTEQRADSGDSIRVG